MPAPQKPVKRQKRPLIRTTRKGAPARMARPKNSLTLEDAVIILWFKGSRNEFDQEVKLFHSHQKAKVDGWLTLHPLRPKKKASLIRWVKRESIHARALFQEFLNTSYWIETHKGPFSKVEAATIMKLKRRQHEIFLEHAGLYNQTPPVFSFILGSRETGRAFWHEVRESLFFPNFQLVHRYMEAGRRD